MNEAEVSASPSPWIELVLSLPERRQGFRFFESKGVHILFPRRSELRLFFSFFLM